MIYEDYKCDECKHIIKDVSAESGELLPKRIDCPECKAEQSCYRIWKTSFHVPTHFKATEDGRGINKVRNKMKKYTGALGKKHYY